MAETYSRRWRSTPALDVDAFLLADRSWLLFAYVKDGRLADDAKYWVRLGDEFSAEQGAAVAAVGRALKTEQGSEPLAPIVAGAAAAPELKLPDYWCREGWLKYRLEARDALNPGLFLDQEANRARLAELVLAHIAATKGRFGESDGVLNLFSYTGSFSVAAFGAGARAATSVDVSGRYLDWERMNVEANFGGHDQLVHKLFKDDARDVLRRSKAKHAKFRWIIIDPPTFSRGQGKAFKVREELASLVTAASACLSPGGAILASCNDSRWSVREFMADVEKVAQAEKLRTERGRTVPGFPLDHPLKSVWLHSSG